ncbi:MAG: GAF domain-containing protein [Deltaproteobacteria bacterium]|nr:GAF domain-containing protein [Deltaproteobacteria bacterium]
MAGRQQNSASPTAPHAEDAAVTRLLAERARVSFWMMWAALGVLLATDVSLDRAVLGTLVQVTFFQAACVAAGMLALGRARSRRAAATTPILVLAGIFGSGVLSDVATQNPFGTGLSALVTCLVSATFMPWGMWFQLATVLVTAVPSALSVWLCTGSLETLGYAAGPCSILMVASVSVAAAFERARRERARIEHELRLLQSVSLEVGAAPDPDSALVVVLRRTCEASGWVIGQAWTPRADGAALECSAWWSDDPDGAAFHTDSRCRRFARGEGLPGRVWASGAPAWVRELRDPQDFPRADSVRRCRLSVGVGIPVIAGGEVIAVLEFFVRESHTEDTRLMHTLAGAAVQLGAVVQRKRAERLAEEAAQTAEALVEVGRTLSTHLGQPDMFERVTAVAAGALGCDWSATFAWDDATHLLTLVAAAGTRPDVRAGLAAGPLSAEGFDLDGDASARTLVEIPDVAAAPRVPGLLRRLDATAALYVPMRLGGSVMGVQVHGYRARTGPFSTRQRRLAAGVADATAIAVANARLIDDLQASSRLKSEFVATMSHELRTPLNIIVGYSDMLAEGVVGLLSEEQRDTVARVQRAGIELLDLVNATLDMGRLEAGRDAVAADPVDVDAVMHQLDIELGPLVGPGVALVWRNDLGAVPLVGDKQKIKTILKNLVGNALKFTHQGSVDVRAAWDGERVRFAVRDTGVGIPPASLPVIFEMFRQVDGSSTRTFGGVGLGLHIVRRLVDLLAGDITVESTVDEGSTFTVTWQPATSAVPEALRA